ncbi:MAG: Ig-like domain-containing protein, partial [Bacteroidaceae bacterium]|nr:Ig-like domain-containing protein [Bacteroidaceae bacterium]
MANNLQNNIKNGLLTASRLNNVVTNSPANTSPKYSKYNDEATAYYHEYAPYASNVFDAEIQGLDYNDFYKWTKVHLRSSNVINPSTGENLSTSWQSILILDRKVDFIPIGAYVKYNNSIWIVYNPDNIASPTGNTIVIRCNTTYNTLDYYGNLVKTPMFYAKGTVLASSPYYMEFSATLDGYQHVIMQLNDVTEKITNNTRIILGKSAFGMYGVSDFPEEFTGDPNSCHIFRADLRLQETVESDDLVNHVADGKYFSFTLDIGGNNTMIVGEPQTLSITARRKGDIVQSTTENPITYVWTSSDETIATVDEYGVVTPVSVGSCVITCSIQQNTAITSTFSFSVEERAEQSYVDFVTPIPQELRAFDSVEIEAVYYENGSATDERIAYSLTNADEDS